MAEVRDDREARVLRCRGKSYLDLLAQRAGDCSSAPDAVVAPADAAGVAAVLAACAEEGVAVVPFGGGTSVVGGLAGERGGREALISLDLGRLDRMVSVDARSLTAVFEPGIRLPEADAALARARARARARAAELRVGDGRRLRRDALGRADVDRARAHRQAGRGARVRHARGVAGDARLRRVPPPAPRCANSSSGPRGPWG